MLGIGRCIAASTRSGTTDGPGIATISGPAASVKGTPPSLSSHPIGDPRVGAASGETHGDAADTVEHGLDHVAGRRLEDAGRDARGHHVAGAQPAVRTGAARRRSTPSPCSGWPSTAAPDPVGRHVAVDARR